MNKSFKQIRYFEFNFDAIPNEVYDPDTGNALQAFISGTGLTITEERYNMLSPHNQKFWKLMPACTSNKRGQE